MAEEFIRILESGYLQRHAEPESEALWRELRALRQEVAALRTSLRTADKADNVN